MPAKRFSDFAAPNQILDGDKAKLDDILNREILLLSYRVKASKYDKPNSGKCLTIQFELDGEHRVVFTGSQVLAEQFEKYGHELPFMATIKKIDRFYTLV